MHPDFHTRLLKKWYVNAISQPPPTPVKVDGVLEYEVEAIVAHKITGSSKRLQFFIKWAEHGPEHNTWEPASALQDCTAVMNVDMGGRFLNK